MRLLRYEPSSGGAAVELDGPATYIGTGEGLRGRSLSYTLGFRGISGVSRDARECSVKATFTDFAECDRARRVFDADAESASPGELVYAGQWSTKALVVASTPTLVAPSHVQCDVSVVLVDGIWRRPSKASFFASSASGDVSLDYPYDYPHDYASSGRQGQIDACAWARSPARITFYGPCQDPYVNIGGNRYMVEATVPDGAILVLDGLDHTIELVGEDGSEANAFDSGVRGSGAGSGEYCFERLSPGVNPVAWDGTFGFDVEWWEEETEPPWSRQAS